MPDRTSAATDLGLGAALVAAAVFAGACGAADAGPRAPAGAPAPAPAVTSARPATEPGPGAPGSETQSSPSMESLASSSSSSELEVSKQKSPFVLVLGTAQDGGIPHLGGHAAPDQAARRDPALRRLVASLLVVDPASGRRWLVDATPDVALQLERADAVAPLRTVESGRTPIVDGIFLTHAHIGHYLGLAQFGREVYGAERLPVHGSARMVDFLARNGPWDLLVRLGHVDLVPLTEGRAVELAPGLSITPFLVPHRDEYTDTFGFEIRGPRRALLYIPDIDKWERWTARIEERIAAVDVALLDGTFYAEGEIPGRSLAEIPHPFVVESLARFAPLPASERAKIAFIHLNHTNPAALADTPARRAIEAAGLRVAQEGERIEL